MPKNGQLLFLDSLGLAANWRSGAMGEPKWKNGGAIFNPKNRNDFDYFSDL